jgi:sphingosine kinase
MAKSLLHAANEACSISDALFAIIRGHKQPLDVCTIVQGEKKIFSVLSVTWGKYATMESTEVYFQFNLCGCCI